MTRLAARVAADGRVRSRPLPEASVYDNAIGKMSLALAPTTEGDPVGIHVSLLSMVSALVGPGTRVPISDNHHPLLIWTLMIGDTSAGRKGTASDAARRLIKAVDPRFCADNVITGLSSAEGLIAEVQDDDPDGDNEAGHKPDAGDKRRFVYEAEYAVVLTRSRREGNALSSVLRCAWEGADLRVTTKNPLVATAPHIAILGHISPDEFRAKVSAQDLAGGSYNRFLMVYVERSQRLPHGGGASEELVAALAEELTMCLNRASRVSEIGWSDEAKDRWVEIYDEFIAIEDDREVAAWVGRAVPYTRRVAALYAALDGRSFVTPADLDSAAALVRYSLESARFVVGHGGQAGTVEEISNWVASRGADGVSRTELALRYRNRHRKPELDAMVSALVGTGAVAVLRVQGEKGRPAEKLVWASGAES